MSASEGGALDFVHPGKAVGWKGLAPRAVLSGAAGVEDACRVELTLERSERSVVARARVTNAAREPVRLRAMQLLSEIADAELAPAFLAALADPAPAVKLRAVATLRRLADGRAREALAPLLADADDAVRFRAAEALAAVGDRRGVDALMDYVRRCLPQAEVARGEPVTFPTNEMRVRMHAAMDALGRSGDKRVVDLLLPVLGTRNVHFLATVVRALERLGDERAFQPMLKVLDHSSWHGRNPRGAAIDAVAKLGGKRAVKPLIEQLRRKAWQEVYQKGQICRVLGELGDPEAVDAIAEILTIDPIEVRSRAHDALLAIGGPAVPRLLAHLDDADRTKREAVAIVVARIGSPAVEPTTAALAHASQRVRQAAAWTLGQIPDERSVPALVKAIRTEADAEVRVAIAWALGKLKDPRAVDALVDVLARDADDNCRRAAAQALGEIADKRAMQPLIAALKDEHEAVRGMAASALGSLGDAAAVGPLKELRDGDPSADVRATANDALVTIASAGEDRSD